MIQLLFICHLTDCGFHIAPKWVDQKNVLLSSCQLLRKLAWTWFFWSRKCTDVNLTVHRPQKPYYRCTTIEGRDMPRFAELRRFLPEMYALMWLYPIGKTWLCVALCGFGGGVKANDKSFVYLPRQYLEKKARTVENKSFLRKWNNPKSQICASWYEKWCFFAANTTLRSRVSLIPYYSCKYNFLAMAFGL